MCTIPDSNYKNGERVITTVIDDAVELVDPFNASEEEQESYQEPDVTDNDIYVVSGEYSNNQLRLTRNDARIISVDINPTIGWYV